MATISFGVPTSLAITSNLTVGGTTTLTTLTSAILRVDSAGLVATTTLQSNFSLSGGTLSLATTLTSVNSITSVAGQNLVLAVGTGGTALTITTSTLAASFAGALSVTGHTTFEGVTSTGATGSGNLVYSASPTLTGTIAAASLSLSSLTSGRVPFATTAGLLTDASTLTFNSGTGALSATSFVGSGASLTSVVNSITGTSGQVTASASTGAVTLSLPSALVAPGTLTVTGHTTFEGVTSTGATGTGNLVYATSPTLVTPALGTPSAIVLTSGTGLPISTGLTGAGTGVLTALGVNVGTAGAFVVNGGALGTPSSGTLTNATGLPISSGVSGLGTGVATFLATPSSANLAAALTDETGSGSAVFSVTPTLTGSPVVGGVTFTSSTATSLNSITAASATTLTLSGGATSGNVVINTNGSTLAATFSAANATLAGNLTVSGTGTSSFAGLLSVNVGAGAQTLALNSTAATPTWAQFTSGATVLGSISRVGNDLVLKGGSTGAALTLDYSDTAASLSGNFAVAGNLTAVGQVSRSVNTNGYDQGFHTTNTSTGNAASTDIQVGNSTNVGVIRMYGTGFTTSSFEVADSMLFYTNGAGGFNFQGAVKLWSAVNVVGAATFASTATATNTSTGALVVGSNVGLSGNAGGASFFGGNLIVSGGHGWGITSTATAAGTTTLTSSSTIVQVFTGTSTQTVVPPAANAFGAGIGAVYVIKNRSTSNVTITPAGSDTVDGATYYTLFPLNAITLISDGVSAWEVC